MSFAETQTGVVNYTKTGSNLNVYYALSTPVTIANIFNTYDNSALAPVPIPVPALPPQTLVNPFGTSTLLTNGIIFTVQEFRDRFYPANNNGFSPNIAIYDSPCFLLSAQTIDTSSTSTPYVPFDLYAFVLSSFLTTQQISVQSLSPQVLILLQRECLNHNNLCLVKGHVVSLTWDEVVESLLGSGTIVVGNATEAVVVSLNVVFQFTSAVLNNYVYQVIIPFNVEMIGYALGTIS